jgi:hypothetical protein
MVPASSSKAFVVGQAGDRPAALVHQMVKLRLELRGRNLHLLRVHGNREGQRRVPFRGARKNKKRREKETEKLIERKIKNKTREEQEQERKEQEIEAEKENGGNDGIQPITGWLMNFGEHGLHMFPNFASSTYRRPVKTTSSVAARARGIRLTSA